MHTHTHAHTHMETQSGTLTHTCLPFASFFALCPLQLLKRHERQIIFLLNPVQDRRALLRQPSLQSHPPILPSPLPLSFLFLTHSPGNFRLCVKRTHPHPPTHPQLGQRVGDVLQMTGSYGLLQTHTHCQLKQPSCQVLQHSPSPTSAAPPATGRVDDFIVIVANSN